MSKFSQLPILLRPNRTKQILLLGICLVFAAIGVMMVRNGEWKGYLCSGLFGSGVCIFIANMLPNAAYLKIEQDSFTFCSLFRVHTVPWSVVEEFGVFRIKTKRMVGWNYVSSHKPSSNLLSVNRSLTGFEAALPDTYGFKAADLAEEMETVRARGDAARESAAFLLNGTVQL